VTWHPLCSARTRSRTSANRLTVADRYRLFVLAPCGPCVARFAPACSCGVALFVLRQVAKHARNADYERIDLRASPHEVLRCAISVLTLTCQLAGSRFRRR
jgi:hypothetical protein